MEPITEGISPLRRRMLEDVRMRRTEAKTQTSYLRAARRFAAYLRRSPDTASPEEARQFQLHMSDTGVTPQTINVTLTGLRFFFNHTVGKTEIVRKTATVPVPHRIPVVLSAHEAKRLLLHAGNPKYQSALSIAYGAGLRASEVVHLRVGDIDSKRMVIRVDQCNGSRDRYAMLSPVMLECLRRWWSDAKPLGKVLDHGWLFTGRQVTDHLSTRQLHKIVREAAERAGIDKRVSPHTLRHSNAKHLLVRKVDIRVIQVLLGHRKPETTARYTQVATSILQEVISPLEVIAVPE